MFCRSAAFPVVAAILCGAMASAWELDYDPKIAGVESYKTTLVNTSGTGKLYELVIPGANKYTSGHVLIADLSGSPTEIGTAYVNLLGARMNAMYDAWIGTKIPSGIEGDAVVAIIDWLKSVLYKHQPDYFTEEIAAYQSAGKQMGLPGLANKIGRVMALATLPADEQNILKVIIDALEHFGDTAPAIVKTMSARKQAALLASVLRPRTAGRYQNGFCDFFAAWGSRTTDGSLISSRNLDFDKDTGINKYKLVTVYRPEGQHPYATFGFAGFFGALAGMSSQGITVSEANLDNAMVSFRGLAWPLKLRQVMGSSANLAEAEANWAAWNNTGAFNFLLGSGSDAPGTAAVAIEAIMNFNGEFHGNSSVEAAATFQCVNGTKTDGVACRWPGNSDVVHLGEPLVDAVWRSNHALHPTVMATQEPLWNDTVMRYEMLHDHIQRQPLTPKMGVNITSLLGIKGPDYSSCQQDFSDGTNILSVTYHPGTNRSFVAWEDGASKTWSPAACNTYVELDLASLFAGDGPAM